MSWSIQTWAKCKVLRRKRHSIRRLRGVKAMWPASYQCHLGWFDHPQFLLLPYAALGTRVAFVDMDCVRAH